VVSLIFALIGAIALASTGVWSVAAALTVLALFQGYQLRRLSRYKSR
jgi:hypothetical protein